MDQQNGSKNIILRRPNDGPFAYQTMDTTKFIRSKFSHKKQTTAIAVYQSFTECASEEGKRKKTHTSCFVASLPYLAAKSGKSVSTIKRYANEFKQIGILDWECRKRGKFNVSNYWKLLRCPAHDCGGIPIHNNELVQVAHNNELEQEERVRRYITNKGEKRNWKANDGFKSIKDTIG